MGESRAQKRRGRSRDPLCWAVIQPSDAMRICRTRWPWGWDALQLTVRQAGNALTWYEALQKYNHAVRSIYAVQSAYVHNYTLSVFTGYEQNPVDWNLSDLRRSLVVLLLVLLYSVLLTPGTQDVFQLRGRRKDRTRLVPKGATLTWAAELGLAGGRSTPYVLLLVGSIGQNTKQL